MTGQKEAGDPNIPKRPLRDLLDLKDEPGDCVCTPSPPGLVTWCRANARGGTGHGSKLCWPRDAAPPSRRRKNARAAEMRLNLNAQAQALV
eukprot:6212047-Pleurochrysis_carterae.AAC.2